MKKFKLLSVILTAVMLFSMFSIGSFAAEFKLGDVNADKDITIIDAKRVLQAVAGIKDVELARADVNGDNNITIVDAKWILQAVAELRTLKWDEIIKPYAGFSAVPDFAYFTDMTVKRTEKDEYTQRFYYNIDEAKSNQQDMDAYIEYITAIGFNLSYKSSNGVTYLNKAAKEQVLLYWYTSNNEFYIQIAHLPYIYEEFNVPDFRDFTGVGNYSYTIGYDNVGFQYTYLGNDLANVDFNINDYFSLVTQAGYTQTESFTDNGYNIACFRNPDYAVELKVLVNTYSGDILIQVWFDK